MSDTEDRGSERAIARLEAWDRFIAKNEVEPTMGWVHVAFNDGFGESWSRAEAAEAERDAWIAKEQEHARLEYIDALGKAEAKCAELERDASEQAERHADERLDWAERAHELERALEELVRLKELKDGGRDLDWTTGEKDKAWKAARAALTGDSDG